MSTPTQAAHGLFRYDPQAGGVVSCAADYRFGKDMLPHGRRFAVVLGRGADLTAAHSDLQVLVRQGRPRAAQAFGVLLLEKNWRPRTQKEAGDFRVMTSMARVFYPHDHRKPSEVWKGITIQRTSTALTGVELAYDYFTGLDAIQEAYGRQVREIKQHKQDYRSGYFG